MRVTVLGAGSWGTTVAALMCRRDHEALLWARERLRRAGTALVLAVPDGSAASALLRRRHLDAVLDVHPTTGDALRQAASLAAEADASRATDARWSPRPRSCGTPDPTAIRVRTSTTPATAISSWTGSTVRR